MNKIITLSICLVASLIFNWTATPQIGSAKQASQQSAPNLKGCVLDEAGKPLALATVTLLNKEGTVLDGVILGDDGTFSFNRHLSQAHKIHIKMQGYENKLLPIRSGQNNLGTIQLQASNTQLQTVEIMGGKHQTITMQGTSLTASVASTSLSKLSTALDILSSLPFVKVDKDGVMVQGRGLAIIYLGHQLISQDELQRLNPQDIKEIEIILIPDATYPNGTPAVIRIKTKKLLAKRGGIYLRGDLSKTPRWGYYLLGQAYYNTPKLSFKVGAVHNYWTFCEENKVNLKVTDISQEQRSNMQINNTSQGRFNNIYINSVYRPKELQELGLSYSLVLPVLGLKSETSLRNNLEPQPGIHKESLSFMTNYLLSARADHSVNIYYHGSLSSRLQLHAEGNIYVRGRQISETGTEITNLQGTKQDWNKAEDSKAGENYSWRSFLEYQLKKGKLQFGQDGTISTYRQNYQQFNTAYQQLLPTSNTEHQQVNLGIFASWNSNWGKHFTSQLGLRLERHSERSLSNGQIQNKEHHWNFFPSLTLSYRLKHFSSSLSYENIVRRPHYWKLRSNIGYANELFLESGNPQLKPMILNKLSLNSGYKDWTLSFSSRWFKDYPSSNLRRYKLDPNRLLFYQDNYDLFTYSATLAYAPQIGWWRPSWQLELEGQDFSFSGHKFNSPSLNWEWSNLFSFPQEWTFKLTASGSTTNYSINIRSKASWSLDFNLIKKIGEHLQLSLTGHNILMTTIGEHYTHYSIAEVYNHNKRTYGYTLRANYNLNTKGKNYRGGQAGQDERNRF